MGGTDDRIKELNIAYHPLPSQKRFHQSGARFKGFSGPVGCGKSQALCQEALRMAYLNPGRTGLLGAPTYPMLRDATLTTLLEILESNRIPFEHNKGENILVLRDCRSRILLRAVEDFERLRGTNLAWFGLDELTYTPQEAWVRMVARLRDPKAKVQCGFAVWTPKGFDWVHRTFIAEPRQKEYAIIQALPKENEFLGADYYENLRSCYDENFYRQEVLGEYLNMTGGVVYTAFSREHNVRKLERNPGIKLLWALDFNVDPLSSAVVQIEDGIAKVIDEIVLRHSSTQKICEEFVRRYGKHRLPVEVFGDASGYQHRTTGNTDYDIITEHMAAHTTLQIHCRASHNNPTVRERIMLVNRLLRSASGETVVHVDEKCTELIKDFEQVAYKEDTFHIDKDRDRMRTHISDAVGYLLWEVFSTGGGAGERDQRLI